MKKIYIKVSVYINYKLNLYIIQKSENILVNKKDLIIKKQTDENNITYNNMNEKTNIEKRLYNKNKIIEFDLSEYEYKEIINNKNIKKMAITKINNNIKTKFLFTSSSKNYIYYNCSQKRTCSGKAKIDLKTNKFIITTLSNKDINHEKLTYDELVEKIKNNILESIDFKDKDIQKQFVFFVVSENNDIDNPALSNNFYNLTKEKITLTKSQI